MWEHPLSQDPFQWVLGLSSCASEVKLQDSHTGLWRLARTSGDVTVHSSARILANTQLILRHVLGAAPCSQKKGRVAGKDPHAVTITYSLLSPGAVIIAHWLSGSFFRIPLLLAVV